MEVSLAPATLDFGAFTASNALVTAVFLAFLFLLLGFYASRRFSLVPTRLQVALELVLEFVTSQLRGSFRSQKRAESFAPLILSMLLFLVVANQLTVVPLVGQMVLGGQPLFKTVTSHLSATLALALVALGTAHAIALYLNPLGHLGNYFKLPLLFKARNGAQFIQAVMDNFLAALDVIGELAKLMSLSFRLFGNILAGELMIAIIAGISFATKLIVPVPFLALSIFSGMIQAAVFTLLTVAFISGTVQSAEPAESQGGWPEAVLKPPEPAVAEEQ